MAQTAKKTEVATLDKGGALSTGAEFEGLPSGLENVTGRDLLVPRLTILQGLSPQLNKSKPEYIKGAEVGDFCDTATGDIFKDKMKVLPCYFATIYLQWAPLASGKGLQHNHGMDRSILEKCKQDDMGRFFLDNGDAIMETATYYVLNMTAAGRRSFIPLSSTMLKVSRKWMTLITTQRVKRGDGTEFPPPIFYRSWDATIVQETNNKGTWGSWKFEPAETILELDPTKSLLEEAKNFYEQARSGLVQGDLNSFVPASEMASGSTAGDDKQPM